MKRKRSDTKQKGKYAMCVCVLCDVLLNYKIKLFVCKLNAK